MFNTIPMVIIFFVFQRYFIQGAATSGLGGR
jgi:ABC-type glycerol-3-phosphate transport system permease component